MALENKFNPSAVYIPLTDSKAKLASVKAEVGSSVKVGTLLAEKYFGKHKTLFHFLVNCSLQPRLLVL